MESSSVRSGKFRCVLAATLLMLFRAFCVTSLTCGAFTGLKWSRFPVRTARPRVITHAQEDAALTVAQPLKLAGTAMSVLQPVFLMESKLQALGYDQTATRAALMTEVTSAPVVIYTYSLSPFCQEALRVLDAAGATYKEVVLGPEWFLMIGEGAAKRAELAAAFGRSSLPHIFIGGRSIGGLTEGNPGLLPLLESGDLKDALQQVGAVPSDSPFGFIFDFDRPKQRCLGSDFCETRDG